MAGAGGAFGVSSGADEVAVDLAVEVLGVGHDEPGATLAAVDGAFEVVVADLGGFSGGLVCGEDCLDLVPDFGGNERGVVSLVLGATPSRTDFAEKVRQRSPPSWQAGLPSAPIPWTVPLLLKTVWWRKRRGGAAWQATDNTLRRWCAAMPLVMTQASTQSHFKWLPEKPKPGTTCLLKTSRRLSTPLANVNHWAGLRR